MLPARQRLVIFPMPDDLILSIDVVCWFKTDCWTLHVLMDRTSGCCHHIWQTAASKALPIRTQVPALRHLYDYLERSNFYALCTEGLQQVYCLVHINHRRAYSKLSISAILSQALLGTWLMTLKNERCQCQSLPQYHLWYISWEHEWWLVCRSWEDSLQNFLLGFSKLPIGSS